MGKFTQNALAFSLVVLSSLNCFAQYDSERILEMCAPFAAEMPEAKEARLKNEFRSRADGVLNDLKASAEGRAALVALEKGYAANRASAIRKLNDLLPNPRGVRYSIGTDKSNGIDVVKFSAKDDSQMFFEKKASLSYSKDLQTEDVIQDVALNSKKPVVPSECVTLLAPAQQTASASALAPLNK